MAARSGLFDIINVKLSQGEFFDESDEKAKRRVAVVGKEVADELFPNGDALGQTIRITSGSIRQTYVVIGVLEKSGNLLFLNPDRSILVPFASAENRLFRRKNVSMIVAQAISENMASQAVSEIDSVLFEKFQNEDRYRIVSQDALLETINQTMAMLSFMLGSIAGISLLVGGIGIMNIMLVTVTERTREIGVRKAIGASRRHILLQFLLESIVLTFVAGLLGIAAGFGLSRIIASIGSIQTTVTPTVVLIAVSVSVMVGLFFGVWPAMRASKLDPVEALRYE
jgi:putative ABC transport system permease protein